MSDTFEKQRKTIAALAKESFADHVVTELGPGEWRCAAPGTWMHGFVVIARPCYVIVYGDIGDWVIQHSDRDSVGWLQRAARDYEYLCGKIRAGEKRRFYVGDAIAHLEQEIGESDNPADCAAARVKDALGSDFTEHEWYESWAEEGVGCHDVPSCERWDAGPLWMAEALRWLVEQWKAKALADAQGSITEGDHR